ncbi:MAG: hypothetical protein V4850_20650 [Myxococcota bacterium]
MNAHVLASLVDGAIPLLGGTYCTLIAWRLVGHAPGTNVLADERHLRYGAALKVLGPAVVLFGLLRIGFGLNSGSSAPQAPDSAALSQALAGIQPGEERLIGEGISFKLHRAQVAAETVDGWQVATSSEGGFSVELPLSFNDFRSTSKATDGVEIRAHSVGGKTAGLLSWSATCIARRDGTLGPGPVGASDETEILGSPPRAHQRVVRFDDMICTLIVEAQGADALPAEDDRLRFLRSLSRTGALTW